MDNWAKTEPIIGPVATPEGAVNLNVAGRRLLSPLQGFGQMWKKVYKVRLSGSTATPQEVVAYWKEHLPELMPASSRFYPSVTGVKPGEVILINATLPGLPLNIPVSTGVMVIYSDDESFTVTTPEGHPISGFNTFSAYDEDGATVATVTGLIRANDPIYEFGFHFMGGAAREDALWEHVLISLAAHFGVNGQVQLEQSCIDSRLQWGQAKNVWYNASLRTMLTAPLRWAGRVFKTALPTGA